MLEPHCLAVFVAIAEERSFSRAADRLGIAQSVASKRLRRLEDHLCAVLLDRSIRSNVRLTRIGELFLPEARATLAGLRRAEQSCRNLARGRAGPFRIGFVFSAAMNGTLTKMLSGLRAVFPELCLEPQLMETPEQLSALEEGLIDVGLLRPRPSYPQDCSVRIVHEERLITGLALHHPLAAHLELTPPQLMGSEFILPQFHEDVGLVDSARRLAEAGHFTTPNIIRTDDFVTAACLAATGDGIVLAPASLARLAIEGICFRPFRDFDDRLTTVMVMRRDAPAEAARVAIRVTS